MTKTTTVTRSWKVSGVWPIYEEFKVVNTEVQIVSDDGKSILTETLTGDQTDKKHNELIVSVIDMFVKREKTDVMVTEAVLKVDELNAALKANKESLNELKDFKEVMALFMENSKADIQAIANAQTEKIAELKTQFDIINNSFMELLMEKYGGDSDDTEHTEPDGEETVPATDGEAEAIAN